MLNELASPHAQQWATSRGNFHGTDVVARHAGGVGARDRARAAAVRRRPRVALDPRAPQPIRAWRAFAAFTGSALLTFWLYTAVKAAYLSTVFATRVEERNLIYLGAAADRRHGRLALREPAAGFPGALAALAFTAWLVLHYGYQLDYPYFEAPGYGDRGDGEPRVALGPAGDPASGSRLPASSCSRSCSSLVPARSAARPAA